MVFLAWIKILVFYIDTHINETVGKGCIEVNLALTRSKLSIWFDWQDEKDFPFEIYRQSHGLSLDMYKL